MKISSPKKWTGINQSPQKWTDHPKSMKTPSPKVDGYKPKYTKVEESSKEDENSKSKKWTSINQSPQKWMDHPKRMKTPSPKSGRV